VTSEFVPFVPGTRRDSRRNKAALALLAAGATEVVVLEEDIDSYKRNGRSYASKNASAKLANFKKQAVKAGFNVHAFTRPSSTEGDPVAIEGVVQVISDPIPSSTWAEEAKADIAEAARVEAEVSAKRGVGRPSPKTGKKGDNRTQQEVADAQVQRFLNNKRRVTSVGSWNTWDVSAEEAANRVRRARNSAQRVRVALKRAGVEGAVVSVRETAQSVRVDIVNKK
jgi:hypothetical protein